MKYTFVYIILTMLFLFALGVDYTLAANSATVTWNANTEPDLSGYKIYYGLGTWNGTTWVTPRTGTNPGSGTNQPLPKCGLCGYPTSVNGTTIPVSVGKVTSYTINNLSNGQYYFSISAIDTSGNESSFSSDTTTTYKFVSMTADLNGSGAVNGQDFSMLLGWWLSTTRPPADINQSGQVSGQDFSIMMGQWTG